MVGETVIREVLVGERVIREVFFKPPLVRQVFVVMKRLMNLISSDAQNHKHYGS